MLQYPAAGPGSGRSIGQPHAAYFLPSLFSSILHTEHRRQTLIGRGRRRKFVHSIALPMNSRNLLAYWSGSCVLMPSTLEPYLTVLATFAACFFTP